MTADGFENRSLPDAVIVFGASSAVEPPVIDVGRSGLGQDGFTVVFSSQVGVRYTVEYSEDVEGWDSLGTVVATGGQTSYLDPGALGRTRRYYRVKGE